MRRWCVYFLYCPAEEVELALFMEEPSVLDYLKSKLLPWKYPPVTLQPEPQPEESQATEPHSELPVVINPQEVHKRTRSWTLPKASDWPWRPMLALTLALLAQRALEPQPDRTWKIGLVIYLLALVWAAWSNLRNDWSLEPLPAQQLFVEPLVIRAPAFIGGLLLALLAFITSGGNRFTYFNLICLVSSLVLIASACRAPIPNRHRLVERLKTTLSLASLRSLASRWRVVLLVVFVLVACFRFYQLSQVPLEMTSEHAENILDISRLINGETAIYFPGNGGREGLDLYLAAALHKYFQLDVDFTTLKLVSALIGFLALPFLYLLGKELGSRRIGLLAVLLAGVAYWPNVVSRIGLRQPFYILSTAAMLYFFIHGTRTGGRNYFILAGLCLGLGFYGYGASYILPLVLMLGAGLYLLHEKVKENRRQMFWSSLLAMLLASVLILPLLRYTVAGPGNLILRSLTGMNSLDTPLPGPAVQIFLQNLGRALTMFSWSNGEVWTLSIPFRPALEIVSAGLFWVGFLFILIRYIRQHHWLDLFLCLSILLLLLPSILNLAAPAENPNLFRTGGALVPVFLIIATSLDGFMTSLEKRLGAESGTRIALAVAVALFLLQILQSYNLVFRQYAEQYRLSAWNSSEISQVARSFTEMTGNTRNIWIIGYPYWVDTRLVGMQAGISDRNPELSKENIGNIPFDSKPKLFILKPEDQESLNSLKAKFPVGWQNNYVSNTPGKDFLIYIALPDEQQPEQ